MILTRRGLSLPLLRGSPALGFMRAHRMDDVAKGAEILVLRHQLAMVHR
jgi:hypothetical protein